MRTLTISQAARDMLIESDPEQQAELSLEIVNAQGGVGSLEFRHGIRVLSMQRDDGGEKEIRGHCSPSTLSDDETDWNTDDAAYDAQRDLLSDYEAPSNWAETDGFDWRDAEVEPEEFHKDLSRPNEIDVDTDSKVSRETRAFQEAIELGLRYGWDIRNIKVLTSVFEENGWSATKKSLDREMENGMSPEELTMAMQLGGVWGANPEFASVYLRGGYYGDRSISVIHQNTRISWPAALKIVRAFDSVVDEAEMESLLLDFYDEWISDWSLMNEFTSFANYLLYCLGLAQGSLDAIPGWAFEELDE